MLYLKYLFIYLQCPQLHRYLNKVIIIIIIIIISISSISISCSNHDIMIRYGNMFYRFNRHQIM